MAFPVDTIDSVIGALPSGTAQPAITAIRDLLEGPDYPYVGDALDILLSALGVPETGRDAIDLILLAAPPTLIGSFREDILGRVIALLSQLEIGPDAEDKHPDGFIFIERGNYRNSRSRVLENNYAVLSTLKQEPLEELPVDRVAGLPIAYVTFDGGRNDLGVNTFLSHVVETLGIRIEVLLHRKIGIQEGAGVRSLELQVADFMHAVQVLITRDNLSSAVAQRDHVTVQDVVIEEWLLDDRFRGGDREVLSILVQAQVANQRDAS